MWRGSLSPRKAATLACALPSGCATFLAVGGEGYFEQGTQALYDVLGFLQMKAWVDGQKKGPKPKQIKPPPSKFATQAKEAATNRAADAFRSRLNAIQQG